MNLRLLLSGATAALIVVMPGTASAQVKAGPTVCRVAALAEAEEWTPMVSMMDIILENPDQTAEQRANAEEHRAQAVTMRDAAQALAARFQGAPDPNRDQIASLLAMSDDDHYELLQACDDMQDSFIAAMIRTEQALAKSAAAIREVENALAFVEGSVPFSTTIRDDYASRVNCSVAYEVRADAIRAATGSSNPDSAVYKTLIEWKNGLVAYLETYTGDRNKVSSDRVGVYPEWTQLFRSGSGYTAAADACTNIVMGASGPKPIPAPETTPLSASAAAPPASVPPRPASLFKETVWLGDEIFYRFKPSIPNMFMGNARYGDGGQRQAMLLQLLAPPQGAVAMIAHQYAVDCQAGTIWWLEERKLDSGGAIVGVAPHPNSAPAKPDNPLGQGILNATCGMGFTEGEARTASGWRKLHP